VVEIGIVDATLQITIEDTTTDYWTYYLLRYDSIITTQSATDTFQVFFTDINLLPTTLTTHFGWMIL
jgi:hypothetical protein